MQRLYSSRPDVRALAKSKNSSRLQKMIEFNISNVTEVYPWAKDLKEAAIDSKEIAKAIIETENVTWGPESTEVPYDTYGWRNSPHLKEVLRSLGHTGDTCAHQIITRMNPSWDGPVLDWVNPEFQLPISQLDKIARWEEVVFKHCGIGGVLHPDTETGEEGGEMYSNGDTAFLVYTHRAMKERPDLLHRESLGFLKLLPTLVLTPLLLTQEISSLLTAPLSVAAPWFSGTRSPSGNPIGWHKSAMHGAKMSDDKETYIWDGEHPHNSKRSKVTEIWNHGLLKNCVSSLKAVLLAMEELNKLGGCCDSFPVFVKHFAERKLSTVDIRFDDILNLAEMLSQLLGSNSSETVLKDKEWRSKLCVCTLGLYENLFQNKDDIEMFLYQCTQLNGIAGYVLHLAALCAQMFSIGLVTYCGGHCSDFYTPEISRTIEKFHLQGISFTGPSIVVEKVELSCLGGLVQRPVWTFRYLQSPQLQTRVQSTIYPGITYPAKHDIEARISQLLEIWDTTIIVEDKHIPEHAKLQMGSGYISKAKRPILSLTWPDNMLHWSSEDDGIGLPISYLEKDVQVVVGAITENPTCKLTRLDCENKLAGHLVDLRTQAGHWKPHTRTTGITGGVGGGPIAPVNLAFNHSITQLWCPPVFRKGSAMQQWNENPDPPLAMLNEPWGLEFSLCTAVARRVPLRALLDTTVVSYLQSRNPTATLDTKLIERIRRAASNDEATAMYEHLARVNKDQFKVLQVAVKHLVEALQWARLSSTKKSLLLWWPEPSKFTTQGIELDHSWYTNGPWIPILEDSENSALFGLATWRCLEESKTGRVCRNRSPSAQKKLCKKLEFILHTGVGPYNAEQALSAGEHLMIESRNAGRHVFKIQKAATAEQPADLLEYRGVWSRPALWRYNVRLKMVENADLVDKGKEVVVRHQQPD